MFHYLISLFKMFTSVTFKEKDRVSGPEQGRIYKRPTIPNLNCEPKFDPLAPKLIGHQLYLRLP